MCSAMSVTCDAASSSAAGSLCYSPLRPRCGLGKRRSRNKHLTLHQIHMPGSADRNRMWQSRFQNHLVDFTSRSFNKHRVTPCGNAYFSPLFLDAGQGRNRTADTRIFCIAKVGTSEKRGPNVSLHPSSGPHNAHHNAANASGRTPIFIW
jgi:hypothetical protein